MPNKLILICVFLVLAISAKAQRTVSIITYSDYTALTDEDKLAITDLHIGFKDIGMIDSAITGGFSIKEFKNLESIYLSFSRFKSDKPKDSLFQVHFLNELGTLPQLVYMNLQSAYQLELTGFNALSELDFTFGKSISTKSLIQLPKLTSLGIFFEDSPITVAESDPIFELKNLKTLFISWIPEKTIFPYHKIGELDSLELIMIYNCYIDSIPRSWGALPNLLEIQINHDMDSEPLFFRGGLENLCLLEHPRFIKLSLKLLKPILPPPCMIEKGIEFDFNIETQKKLSCRDIRRFKKMCRKKNPNVTLDFSKNSRKRIYTVYIR